MASLADLDEKVTKGDDEVDLEKFMEVVAVTSTKGDGKNSVLAAFEAMDTAGTGTINASALSAILQNSGETMTKGEVNAAISKYGADIPYRKFVDDLFAGVPKVASSGVKMGGGGGGGGAKKAPAPRAAPPPQDDFGGGFGDEPDDDEFGF